MELNVAELNTVNVIEIDDNGIVRSLKSFPEGRVGNVAAEQLFITLIKETDEDISNDDVEECVDNGMWTDGGWTVILAHST